MIFVFYSHQLQFFSWSESIRNTLDIENNGDSCDDPLGWWHLGLKLSSEHVGVSSSLRLVAWALVNTSVLLHINLDESGSAIDDWHHTEWLLGE